MSFEGTFIQKLILAVVLGFLTAGGIKYFRVIVVDANKAVNPGDNRDIPGLE